MSNSKFVNFNNLREEERFMAVLDYVERERRGALPLNMDDPTTDALVMKEAILRLGSQMAVLRSQAAPKSTPEFLKMINSCHSIRPTWIERETKFRKRQHFYKCDACGRQEEWCGFAIDVAGHNHSAEYYSKTAEYMSVAFNKFIGEYIREIGRANKEPGMLQSDCGRFYIGETCFRKTLLQYQCSTFVQEIFYAVNNAVQNASEEELNTPDLVWATPEQAEEYRDLRDKLVECVANEQERPPIVAGDRVFWNLIDSHREMEAKRLKSTVDDVVRQRSKEVLSAYRCHPVEGGEEEEKEEEEDSDESDPVWASPTNSDNEKEEEEEEEILLVRRKKMSAHGGSRRSQSIVIGDSDDEEAEDGQVAAPKRTSKRAGKQPVSKRQKSGGGVEPVRRGMRTRKAPDYLGRSSSNAMEEDDEDDKEEDDDEEVGMDDGNDGNDGYDDNHGLYVQVDAPQGNTSRADASNAPDAPSMPGPRVPQPTAASIAKSMRIPSESGVPGPLGSRKNALLDLMDVQRLLVSIGNYTAAAKVSRSILTMLELMELSQRQ
jgi:hypothetical protein